MDPGVITDLCNELGPNALTQFLVNLSEYISQKLFNECPFERLSFYARLE
jgi:hypothetical protein